MTEEAVTRAIQSAAREAFRLGKASVAERGRAAALQENAVTYATDLILPLVEMAVQEAIEARWIEDHGQRHSAPDRTL